MHVPWLPHWNEKDEKKFKSCESKFSLEDLIKYREWAFTEISIEAKRYFSES